jgi:hypothetical protein
MARKPKPAPTLDRQVYLIDRRIKLGKLSPALLNQLLDMREVLVRRMDAEFGAESDDSAFADEQRRVLSKLTGKALTAQREAFRVEAQRKAHREAIAALAKPPATPKQLPAVPVQQVSTKPGMTHEQVHEYLGAHSGTAPRDEVRRIIGLCVSCPRPRKRATHAVRIASTGTPCYTGNPELHGRRKPRPVSQITGGCDGKPLRYRYTRVQAEAGSL